MRVIRGLLLCLMIAAVPAFADAADVNCKGPGNVEEFRYSWKMRGGLAWVAGLVFPTSGVGKLKTTFPQASDQAITSQLLIQANDQRSGFFVYESEMDQTGEKTLMTYHGYAWKNKSRKERTIFDYIKRIAQIHKETPDKQWDRTEALPADALRDVLTAIFFLRQNATTIQLPITTRIYSDGRSYPVTIRSADRRTFNIEGQQVNALGFEIVDAPGGSRKWPGGVKVWVSEDQRRIPFRIDIDQSMGSLQLDLKSVEACAFMQAAAR
jgi:hypothetical protein